MVHLTCVLRCTGTVVRLHAINAYAIVQTFVIDAVVNIGLTAIALKAGRTVASKTKYGCFCNR